MMIKHANWAIFEKRIGCALVHKVASTSINQLPELIENVTPGVAYHKCDTRIAWIRDPIERLADCYAYFKSFEWQENIPHDSMESWETFVDYMLRVPRSHWMPHYELLTCNGIFIPNVIYQFEELGSTFKNHTGIDLPLDRFTEPFEGVIDYRMDELKQYYQEDYNLRD